MSVRFVNPEQLSKPIGFSHAAIGEGQAIAIAGQIGCGADGVVVEPDNIVAQFALALDNLLVALRAAGGAVEDLASLRIYTTDVPGYKANLKALGAAYRERLGRHFPAMALLGVAALFDDGAQIEIEGVAYVRAG